MQKVRGNGESWYLRKEGGEVMIKGEKTREGVALVDCRFSQKVMVDFLCTMGGQVSV